MSNQQTTVTEMYVAQETLLCDMEYSDLFSLQCSKLDANHLAGSLSNWTVLNLPDLQVLYEFPILVLNE